MHRTSTPDLGAQLSACSLLVRNGLVVATLALAGMRSHDDVARSRMAEACRARWEELRANLVVKPVSTTLSSEMPSVAYVPHRLQPTAWVALATKFSRSPEDEVALTQAYITYLNTANAIFAKKLRPLAGEVELVADEYRSREAAAIEAICDSLWGQAMAINQELRTAEARCFQELQARAHGPEELRMLDRARFALLFASHREPTSFFQALTTINCDDLVGPFLEWCAPEVQEQIELRLDVYRAAARKLFLERESAFMVAQCEGKKRDLQEYETSTERLEALSRARMPLKAVEEQIHKNNVRAIADLARLLNERDGQTLVESFQARAYPHLFPDPTDLESFVDDVISLVGHEPAAGFNAAATEMDARRLKYAQKMMEAYVEMAWSFILTRGGGDAYRQYLVQVAVLAARRLSNAQDLIQLAATSFTEAPQAEAIAQRCAAAEQALSAARNLTAFPGQGLTIELDPEAGVARMLGISHPFEVPIPR